MPYSIEKVPDAPILILTQENRQAMAEMSLVIEALTALLNAQPEPAFLVMSVQGPAFALDDMSVAASAMARRQSALLLHRNVRETLLIARAGPAWRAALGPGTAVLGQAKVRRFDTVEQAVSFCYERLGA